MNTRLLSLFLLAVTLQAGDIYATFTVQAKQSANLSFSANGVVNHVYVDIGDTVHKGQVLATLRSEDIQAALTIARVGLTYAQKDYDRMQAVRDVTDQAKLDSVQFRVDNAKAQLAYKQALLDKTILKAPFDGTIVARNLEIGDSFTAVRPVAVYRLESAHARKLILSFDQKYWKVVKAGETFTYTVDGDPAPRKGVLTKLYPTANLQSRKMQAEVAAEDIPSGLFGEGKIHLPDTHE